jgi:uncharacterized protein YbaP (TraB family)
MPARALLWRIKVSPGSTHFIFLFGTMHSGSRDAVHFAAAVKPFINLCTTYYGETDLDNSIITSISSKSVSGWHGLKSTINPPSYQKARRILLNRCQLDLDHVETMPPMILNTLLGEYLMPKSDHQALDLILWKHASSLGLKVNGLESALEQKNIYKKIPLSFQIQQLKWSIKHISSSTQLLTRLGKAYFNQDLDRLLKLSRSALGPVRSVLLKDRNKVMASRILDILRKGEHGFVAVGAAHLPGLNGVLRLIRLQGGSIEPVKI